MFFTLYLISTYFLVPKLSPLFGREKIEINKNLEAHFFLTDLLNRNYVNANLNRVLINLSKKIKTIHPELKVIYLDANFPFIDGFPLLPHLSHNDGKKIDITLIYKNKENKITNKKKSNSGYGVFEEPKINEVNQTEICKRKNYFQYDFPKYLTFGTINKELFLSEELTKQLILEIIKQKEVQKVFIEPHLKTRLKLKSNKIRFHGCKAVRHDDHIHFQIN